MRRATALIGAMLLLASLPGAATARPPFRETVHAEGANCFGLPVDAGAVELSGFVDDFGSDAWIDVWNGQPYESDVILTRDQDAQATVEFSGDTVTMSIPVVPTGVDPTVTGGTATVQGTLTEVGPVDVRERFRDGNSFERLVISGTAYALDGTLLLPGMDPEALDPAYCQASKVDQVTFASNPNAAVYHFDINGGACELENAAGDTAIAFPFFEEGFAAIDGSVTDPSGAHLDFFGSGEPDGDGVATFPVEEYDPDTGEPLGLGSVTISVQSTGETFSYTLRTSSGFSRVSVELLDVEGSLSTSLGDFDLGSCVSTTGTVKEVTTPSNGPKPGGKRPANDLPSGAIALKPGAKATVATKGAQQAAEGPYPCLTFIDPFDGQEYTSLGEHTVWYTVAGTGGEITVDTAGSSFDTVIAVYEGGAGGEVVACVDDTPLEPIGRTLQGSATFATTAGTTYWIQVGGLNEEPAFGPDAAVPYGTLRVAVR